MNAIDCSPALLRETVRLALPPGWTYERALSATAIFLGVSSRIPSITADERERLLLSICTDLCGGNKHAGSILANDVIYGGGYE